MVTFILCLMIQSAVAFDLRPAVNELKKQTTYNNYPCVSNNLETQTTEKYVDDTRNAKYETATEVKDRIYKLENLLKQILPKSFPPGSEGDYAFENKENVLRNFLTDWFAKIWKKPTTTAENSNTLDVNYKDLDANNDNATNAENEGTSLTKVLEKLSDSLDQLTAVLKEQKCQDDLVFIKIPHNFGDSKTLEDATRRKKRNLETESTNSLNISAPFRVYYLRRSNKTLHNDTKDNATRRNHHVEEIRDKLYAYIDDKFDEVTKKAEPLQNLRNSDLGANGAFKIGYVIANLDVLIENIKKLKADTDSKRGNFDEKLFLDTFNKLKSAIKVVANIESTINKSLRAVKV